MNVNRILSLLVCWIVLTGCSTREHPEPPPVPLGPTEGEPKSPSNYVVASGNPGGNSTHDSDTIWLCCRIDWGDGTTSGWDSSVPGRTACQFTHEWERCGNYYVAAQARSEDGQLSAWSESLCVGIRLNRSPVVTWGPAGPQAGTRGIEYRYAAAASDSDRNRVEVRIDWGDGEVSPWTPAQASGDTFELTHAWQTAGRYNIRAQAEDSRGNESAWSPDTEVTICVDTSGWNQQATLNSETGAPKFSGNNPNGDSGSLGGTFVVACYPEFGGYMWELAPDGSDVKYEHIDLTGYYGADSIRVEWSCRDGHGGQAMFQISVNDRGIRTCTNPDTFGLHGWWWRGRPSLLHWNSSDNYVRLRNVPGAAGKLLVGRIQCYIFGAWTTDATPPPRPASLDSDGPARLGGTDSLTVRPRRTAIARSKLGGRLLLR